MKINLKRWLSFVFVFIILTAIWTTLAAAAPHENIENITPPPGVLEPGSPTYSIIIGAIVILTIIVTSSVFRKQEHS